ncbi:MAG TPA: DUF1365 domain-containing protein [Solirubrobacterales bacterium]|nr:DUF1365 domain-containing protein [Solirubrobacterales bacterium]
MTGSAIYAGRLRHERLRPVEHSFSYRVWLVLADLEELPEAFDRHPMWSARRPAPIRLRRADYLGDPAQPLSEAARDLVAARTGSRPEGPVKLLTMARSLGAGYNPVSFYYLYGRGGEAVEAMIAEVTNTPWGERHHYVSGRRAPGEALGARMAKRMHVSPFMSMDQTYEWTSTEPGDRLAVRIANRERGELVFAASLVLNRRELTPAAMTTVPLAHPPQVLAGLGRIYGNAVRLRLKGAPVHAHPGRGGEPMPAGSPAPSPRRRQPGAGATSAAAR